MQIRFIFWREKEMADGSYSKNAHYSYYMCLLKAKQLADSALSLSNSENPNDRTIALGLFYTGN